MDRLVGRTSDLVLGSAQWARPYGIANKGGPPSPEELGSMLELAARSGVSYIDTARAYGSEEIIGSLVGDTPDWTIITKIEPQLPNESSLSDCLHALKASLDRSRHALSRPVLDVVLLHRWRHRRLFGGKLWELLQEQVSDGLIREIGVSASDPTEAVEALEDSSITWIEVATSLLDQRLYRDGFFDRARERDRKILVRSVFLQGVAFIDHLPTPLAGLQPILDQIDQATRARGLTRPEAFVLFARSLSDVRPVIGCENVGQLDWQIRTWQQDIEAMEWIRDLAMRLPTAGAEIVDAARWET